MHEQWKSRTGFLLASIGSAVGLGNIWRFSYVAGENGGGAFLIVYVVLVVVIGIPLVVAELAIGKRSASDAVTAFKALAPRSAWRHAGWLGIVGATLILSYYSAIAGWALRYFAAATSGDLWQGSGQGFSGYFSRFISAPLEPLGWQLAMLLAATFVVVAGVARGIERLNAILMPFLAVIVIVLAGYAISLPGGGGGVTFLLAPDWSALSDPRVILAALGQAFFSIGVGMGVYLTYGGYMQREFRSLPSSVIIVFGDTLFAIIAGLAIFPAVFAFGANPAAGPELAFIILPRVFLAMPGGSWIAPAFFFLLTAAALTSMVSLLEVPVATAIHSLGAKRWRAVAAIGAGIFLIGCPSGLSYGTLRAITIFGLPILDAIDLAVSNVVLPLASLSLAAFLGWVVPRPVGSTLAQIDTARLGAIFYWAIRVIPALIVALMAYRLSD